MYILRTKGHLPSPELERSRNTMTGHGQITARAMKTITLSACAANSASPPVSSYHCSISSIHFIIITISTHSHFVDFDSHLEMHSAEGTTFDDFGRAAIEDVPTLGRSHDENSSSDPDTPPRTPSSERLCQHGSYVTIGTLVDAQVPYASRQEDGSDGQIRRLPNSPKSHASSKMPGLSKRRRPLKLGVGILLVKITLFNRADTESRKLN